MTADLIIKNEFFKPRNQQFTYSVVQSITNNFNTVIGRGGFGRVYLGHNGDNQVAVKMFSETLAQGYNEFQAKVSSVIVVIAFNKILLAVRIEIIFVFPIRVNNNLQNEH